MANRPEPLHESEIETLRTFGVPKGNFADCPMRLLATIDALRAERDSLLSRLDRVVRSRSTLDCRCAGENLADISGSHCAEPCARCEGERERDTLRKELDEVKKVAQFLANYGSHARGCPSSERVGAPCNCGWWKAVNDYIALAGGEE